VNGISIRTLLLLHLAAFVVLCASGIVGYGMLLAILRAFSYDDLTQIHQHLQPNTAFQDAFAASVITLSATAAGWIAAKTSKTKPLLHGTLSAAGFFLLFLYATVLDVLNVPQNITHLKPLSRLSELAIPLFGLAGAYVATRTRVANSPASSVDAN